MKVGASRIKFLDCKPFLNYTNYIFAYASSATASPISYITVVVWSSKVGECVYTYTAPVQSVAPPRY